LQVLILFISSKSTEPVINNMFKREPLAFILNYVNLYARKFATLLNRGYPLIEFILTGKSTGSQDKGRFFKDQPGHFNGSFHHANRFSVNYFSEGKERTVQMTVSDKAISIINQFVNN